MQIRNDQRNQVCIALGISVVLAVLSVTWWATSQQYDYDMLEQLRYDTFLGRLHASQVRNADPHEAYPTTDVDEITYNTHATHRIRALKTQSYAQAVRIATRLRDRDSVDYMIEQQDSRNDKNMVPWYTLVSSAMSCQECDDMIRIIRNNDKIRYIEKEPITLHKQ